MQKKISAAVLSAVLGLAGVAMVNGQGASETNRPARPTALGEILVVAPRVERNLLQTPTLESAALEISTSVVDDEDIRRQGAGNLTEAMDFATGVFTETRGRKEKQLTSFRGQIYPYPDFAINGVWQRSFWEVPSFFPSAAIGRIEILRSGGAIMVGPNAGLVGAINVVPRRFEQRTTILDVHGGSYGTVRSSLVHGDRGQDYDYTVGAGFYNVDGPSKANAGETFGSFFGTSGWQPADKLSLEITGYGMTGSRELRRIQDPGRKAMQQWEEKYAPYTSYGGVLRTLIQHDREASTALDAGYVLRSGDFQRRTRGELTQDHRERDWEYNAGIMHAHSFIEDNVLRLGLQYNRWTCPHGKRFFVGQRMDVDTLSAVIADEHTWDRLTLDGGVRATRRYYRDYTDTTFNIVGDNLASRPIENEWGDPDVTGTLGAKYGIAPWTAIYTHLAAGTVDTPPGAVSETDGKLDREMRLILDGGVSLDNPELGKLKLGMFATLRRDAVLLTDTRIDQDGELFNTYANSDVRQYGLEIEAHTARFGHFFSLFGNAVVMNSRRNDDDGWRTYSEIPKVTAAAGVNAVAGRYDASLFGKYVGSFENKRFAEDGQYHDLGDFVDLNLTIGAALGRERATRIYANLKNLLDDRYSTVVGYPNYGFQAFVGLEHKM